LYTATLNQKIYYSKTLLSQVSKSSTKVHLVLWKNACKHRYNLGFTALLKWYLACHTDSRSTCGHLDASWLNCRLECPYSLVKMRWNKCHALWRCWAYRQPNCWSKHHGHSCFMTGITRQGLLRIQKARLGTQVVSTCRLLWTVAMKTLSISSWGVSSGTLRSEWLLKMHCSMNRSWKDCLNILEIISQIKMNPQLKNRIFIQLKGNIQLKGKQLHLAKLLYPS